jgi:hypothetical protein
MNNYSMAGETFQAEWPVVSGCRIEAGWLDNPYR